MLLLLIFHLVHLFPAPSRSCSFRLPVFCFAFFNESSSILSQFRHCFHFYYFLSYSHCVIFFSFQFVRFVSNASQTSQLFPSFFSPFLRGLLNVSPSSPLSLLLVHCILHFSITGSSSLSSVITSISFPHRLPLCSTATFTLPLLLLHGLLFHCTLSSILPVPHFCFLLSIVTNSPLRLLFRRLLFVSPTPFYCHLFFSVDSFFIPPSASSSSLFFSVVSSSFPLLLPYFRFMISFHCCYFSSASPSLFLLFSTSSSTLLPPFYYFPYFVASSVLLSLLRCSFCSITFPSLFFFSHHSLFTVAPSPLLPLPRCALTITSPSPLLFRRYFLF